MQNPHVKYLKTKTGHFHLFYYEYGNIFCRSYTANGWGIPQRVAEKTAPLFSLCEYENTAYLLYSAAEGHLFLATSQDFSQWEHRSLLEGIRSHERTKFFLLPTEDSFHLIYHLPTEATGIDSLVYTSLQNGQWEKPYQIDRFMPYSKTPFFARRLSREHIILYYRTGKNVLSAREMLLSPYTMGSVTPIIQTPSPCIDLSIVNDNERIHMLYIVRGMFRTQIVYQYKHTSAISTPRILWEDSNCDHCLIYLEQNNLIAMWTTNGQPLRCISHDGGNTFGIVERYTDTFPDYCTKGELIGTDTAPLNASECFGDTHHGYLPAVFPLPAPPAVPIPPQMQKSPVPQIHKEPLQPQNEYKKQIEEFTALLAQRSEELSAVNARWKAQIQKLEQELQTLKQENQALRPPKR